MKDEAIAGLLAATIACCIVLFLGISIGTEKTESSLKRECERHKAIYLKDKRYTCWKDIETKEPLEQPE
jgi:hypothetical protein